MGTPEQQPNHIPRIDVLRAVAILMVFSSHFVIAIYGNHGYSWIGNWYHWDDSPTLLTKPSDYPFLMATLSKLILRHHGLCIRLSHLGSRELFYPYYWRRFWRIYPLLPPCDLFIYHLAALRKPQLYPRPFVFSSQFLLRILWKHQRNKSLASEVQVYLLYPCLLGFCITAWVFGGRGFFCRSVWNSLLIGGKILPPFLSFTRLLRGDYPDAILSVVYLVYGISPGRHSCEQEFPGMLSRLILVGALLLHPAVNLYRPLLPFRLPVAASR